MNSAEWGALLNEPGYSVGSPWGTPVSGATDLELQALAAWFGRPLPQDYAAFLQLTNGAEIMYSDGWSLRLWQSGEIPDISRGYGYTQERIPGAIAFGSGTGDEVVLFDVRPEHPDGQYPIYMLDYYDVRDGWLAAIRVADSFQELVALRRSLPSLP